MPRNIRATPDAAWQIRSVSLRTRYGPERVEQVYRLLLGDGPASDRQPGIRRNSPMRTAIYARVSTDRQGRQQTIDSQVNALRTWAFTNSHELTQDHVYTDEGYSGSRLDRPGLDGLRDAASQLDFCRYFGFR